LAKEGQPILDKLRRDMEKAQDAYVANLGDVKGWDKRDALH